MDVQDGDIIAQVITFTGGDGGIQQNKFTWEYSGSAHAGSSFIAHMDSWAEDFYELMDSSMQDGMESFSSEYDVIAWDEEEQEWLVQENIGQGSGNVTLTGSGDTLPLQCAPCLVGFTEKPKSRGRKFIPYFTEETQGGSILTAGALTDLAAALAEYLSAYILETGKSVTPGVASTKWHIFLPFVSGLVANNVFTQRRRTKGVGA
jgi:Uncharacterized conserved protein